MIKKGDTVWIKPEWQDAGDETMHWIALEDEDGERVRIGPTNTGLNFPPNQVVETSMLETEERAMSFIDKWQKASIAEVRALSDETFERLYRAQEDINAHSCNVLFLAKRRGTEAQVAEAEDIVRQHARKGYLDDDIYRRQVALNRALNPIQY